ncbi:MAG: hypothetical protein RLZZ224_940 [Verrucomicrobiota bacterium]|jgi:hypothetical protein
MGACDKVVAHIERVKRCVDLFKKIFHYNRPVGIYLLSRVVPWGCFAKKGKNLRDDRGGVELEA